MLIEDLLGEMEEPVTGMKIITDKIANEILNNRDIFYSNERQKEFNELKGLCSVLSIANNHIKTLLHGYQTKVNKYYGELISSEI